LHGDEEAFARYPRHEGNAAVDDARETGARSGKIAAIAWRRAVERLGAA